MDKIITAGDVAKRSGFPSAQARAVAFSRSFGTGRYKVFDGRSKVEGQAVAAIIDHGRWLARCPQCKNYEYVDPAWRMMFCTVCGNNNSGAALEVSFPANYKEIELETLAKPLRERNWEMSNG